MKKALVLVLTLALLAGLFAACGAPAGQADGNAEASSGEPAGAAGGEKQVIKYWYPWGGDSEAADLARMDLFVAQNPQYEFEATYVPTNGGVDNGKLVAAIAGGTPPDLVCSAMVGSVYSLAMTGDLEPVDEAMTAWDLSVEDYNPQFKKMMQYNGSTYIVPVDGNLNLLFVNTKLAREAGLDLDNPPKTIAEVDGWARAMTVVEDGDIKTIGFLPWQDEGGDKPFFWPYMFGADIYDAETNTLMLDDPEVVEAYEWLGSYAREFDPERIQAFASGFGGAFTPDHPFFNEKVAMFVNGNWFCEAAKVYAPDIEYATFPVPGERYGGSEMYSGVYFCPRGAKNVTGAVGFAKFCMEPEIVNDHYKQWRSFPTLDANWDDLDIVKEGDAIFQVVRSVAQSPNAGVVVIPAVENELTTELLAIRDQVMYDDADPEALLTALEERMQKELDKAMAA